MAHRQNTSDPDDFADDVHQLATSLERVLLGLRTQPVVASREISQPVQSQEVVADHLIALQQKVTEVCQIVTGQRFEKEWYSTGELAEILGKSQFTIQERWCNDGRIECEKDPNSRKWRIPGHEVRRLKGGGGLLPK